MVKPDVKHNYYTDLELPNSASIDDVRKAYRKLALQYHPDRNAGREEECVPRFQAIQAANEILGDPASKAKYDQDRRKVGFSSTFAANPSGPNPQYSWAPPPRRTADPTADSKRYNNWAPPRPSPGAAGPAPTGADRFSNFPRPANAAPRKDPAAERAQQFRAWQNMNSGPMNNGPERPRGFNPTAPPPPPPREPQAGAAPTRPRPQRQDTKPSPEDERRAGTRYGGAKNAAPGVNPDSAEAKQTAWQAFHGAGGKPNFTRQKTQRTPRKPGGFDPNAPGSDERPVPPSGSHYSHRHRSEDLGSPFNGGAFPPPPPGPPPGSAQDSHMPSKTHPKRPTPDPLRPFKSRTLDEEAPYSEANRQSTPYGSFIGEKTQLAGDGIRRSASTRDATKLQVNSGINNPRARSTSPIGKQKSASERRPEERHRSFTADDESSGPDLTHSPQEFDGAQASSEQSTPGFGSDEPSQPPQNRPKKKPVPRSGRFPGIFDPTSPAPSQDKSDATQTDSSMPSMAQRPSGQNMYVPHFPLNISRFHSFASDECTRRIARLVATHRGTLAPQGTAHIPEWSVLSSVLPQQQQSENDEEDFYYQLGNILILGSADPESEYFEITTDKMWDDSTVEDRVAYVLFRQELRDLVGAVTPSLDMDVFFKLASIARQGGMFGHADLDWVLKDILSKFPALGVNADARIADHHLLRVRFNVPNDHSFFTPTSGKSRSEESINTNFSPEPFNGTFTGSGDYFPPSGIGRKSSPAARNGQKQRNNLRAATTDGGSPSQGPSSMPPPPRPYGSDETTKLPSDAKFGAEDWEKHFQDPSWAFPAKHAASPDNVDPSKRPDAQTSTTPSEVAKDGDSTSAGTQQNPYPVDDDDVVAPERNDRLPNMSAARNEDADMMDIDSTPPHIQTEAEIKDGTGSAAEPRLYSVPQSSWHQYQQAHQRSGRQNSAAKGPGKGQTSGQRHRLSTSKRGSAGAGLKADLQDFASVEPFAQPTEAGLKDMGDMAASLPFQSQPSAMPPDFDKEPQKLEVPSVPIPYKAPRKLTKANWESYSKTFAQYVKAYHIWNHKMLEHFNQREKITEQRIAGGMSWLEASGEPSVSGLWKYIKEIKEDEQVREAWNVGWEKHAQALNDFEKLRERVKELVMTNRLQDR